MIVLLDPEILNWHAATPNAFYVGKAPGVIVGHKKRSLKRLSLPQTWQRVVRLKCGDPGVFGTQSTEGNRCPQASDIPFEKFGPRVTSGPVAAGGRVSAKAHGKRAHRQHFVLTTGTRQEWILRVPDH